MDITAIFKKLLLHLPLFTSFALLLTKNKPRIFMYHRFCDVHELADGRIDQNSFKWQLKQLQKGWNIMTLGEFIKMKEENVNLPPYIVILTVDDGYEDFYRVAYPCLKEYDLSATFFPTVNFIDGGWLWWDRVSFAMENTLKKNISFEFKSKTFRLDLTTDEGMKAAWMELIDYCVSSDDAVKWQLILKLERDLEIKLPLSPDSKFRAVTWEQLKELSTDGIEIGSHTVNHPIVSRIDKNTLIEELTASKKRIEKELGKAVVSFCYPNGKPDDLNSAVCGQVEKAGYKGAVVSYNRVSGELTPYMLSRMAADSDKDNFLWKLCGMETLVLQLKIYLNRFFNGKREVASL